MRKLMFLLVISIATILMVSCEKEDDTISQGVLALSITDAPIDNSTVSGVYLKIDEVQYHKSNNEWKTFDDFEGPQEFNILELTNGESALMGSFSLNSGTYTQLRFILDAPLQGEQTPTNPGCYIKFNDSTEQPLFVPSGSQTGWKGVGQFTVPSNGTVAVTADFDARKSITQTGNSGDYILKPTIRLIVDDQAGIITGNVSNKPADTSIVVYAYEDETYTVSEADTPMDETASRFPNSVTSSMVDDANNYHLAFLAPMNYDLVVTSSVGGVFLEVLGIVEDVEVQSNSTTTKDIDISNL